MRKLILVLLVVIGFQSLLLAQETKTEYGIKFSGFVKNDFFYDTRQVVSIREGHFLLYPTNVSSDANGNDLNAVPNFNFLSIQSRLVGKITAPDAFGAKVTGNLEADFFGNENTSFADVNGFRLRHAYAKLSWTKVDLLFGQYWHPFFNPSCFSGVISFNTGAPFQPFSRNPQIRATYKAGNLSITGALLAQRDFTNSPGSAALRNSAIPDMNFIIQYEKKDETAKKELLVGAAGEYKMLKPALYTEKGLAKYATSEMVSSYAATFFFKVKVPAVTYKLQAVYGQNLNDMIMLGGYVIDEVLDTTTNAVSYTPIGNLSVWTEIQTNGEKVQFGLWGGYTQNLGSATDIANYTATTVRGGDIASIMRVSPRIVFISGKFNFAFETEYTSVAYATRDGSGALYRDEFGVITESNNVSNIRALFSVILNF